MGGEVGGGDIEIGDTFIFGLMGSIALPALLTEVLLERRGGILG